MESVIFSFWFIVKYSNSKMFLIDRRQPTLCNVFYCESCAQSFASTQNLQLHIRSRRHQLLTWMMNSQPEPYKLIRCNKSESYCYVCDVDTSDVSDHLKTEAHVTAFALADKYLSFVHNKKLNPVQCSKEEIKEMLETLPKPDVYAMLNVIDKIHDPIDEQAVSKIPFFTKKTSTERSISSSSSSTPVRLIKFCFIFMSILLSRRFI